MRLYELLRQWVRVCVCLCVCVCVCVYGAREREREGMRDLKNVEAKVPTGRNGAFPTHSGGIFEPIQQERYITLTDT